MRRDRTSDGNQPGSSGGATQADEEEDFITAFDIMNSGKSNETDNTSLRRSTRNRLNNGKRTLSPTPARHRQASAGSGTDTPLTNPSTTRSVQDPFNNGRQNSASLESTSSDAVAGSKVINRSDRTSLCLTPEQPPPTDTQTESVELATPPDLDHVPMDNRAKGNFPEGFLFALQEPAIWRGKLVNFKNVIQILDTKCLEQKNPVNPRAALICSNHMKIWPITELCTRDLAVGLLKGSELGDIYIASLYCDGEAKRAVPDAFRRLRNVVKKEKKQLLVLMDSNSHSEALWASKKTDRRGREWEEYLANDQGLLVSNIGDNFTFMSHRGQTIIDVTLATTALADKISQWGVVDSVAISDHLSIEMLLHIKGVWTPPPVQWNLSSKHFNTEGFISSMERKSESTQNVRYWDPTTLDDKAMSFVSDMVGSLDDNAPLTSRSTNIAKAGWFDAECKRLLRRCRQIRQYIRNWTRKRRRRGLPEYPNDQKYTWQDYINSRRAFRRRCRRVKRKHWRRFISGNSDTVVVAKLSKKLDRNANAEICCFKHPSGVRCTPAETVQMLKETHFPNSTDRPPDRERTFLSGGLADIEDCAADFISARSVGICISSFKSHKAPGPDKLKMYPFKLLGPKALDRLVNIYKASYLLGAMPDCFRHIQIIMIPKPGKVAYDVPNAHRPISLMNNIMKIPEKLFLWRQEDTNLSLQPLEGEQHGFVKARSCDSAITAVVSRIEHSLMRDYFSAVAFLDFSGAYDGLQNSSMESALAAMGTDPHIISWYKDFFYHRRSVMCIKGVEVEIFHTQGAPQGGIGSPFLWAAVLNELIKIIKNMPGVIIVAYADDLCLITTCPNKTDCITLLQSAVDAVMAWAARHLLALSPTKSEIMLFTKKRNYPSIIDSAAKIRINGHPLNYARGAVRYLGVWLDRNLNWGEHIKIKTKKVKGLLHKLAGVSGDLWGYKPIIGKYCWEGLARPILSFGCISWISALMRKKTVDTQLTSVQRLGYKLMAFFRRSTPNKGLDMLFNVMPIKYHLLKTAAGSYMRTKEVAPFSGEELQTRVTARVSHRTWIEEFIHDLDVDYLNTPLDHTPLHRKWNKAYLVDMASMNCSNNEAGKPRFLAHLDAYTDGSQTKTEAGNRTGAGVVIMRGKKMLISAKRWAAFQYKLSDHNTVFQAEIFAIKKLCQIILLHTSESGHCWIKADENLDIYCDSQAAILALNSIFVQSQLVEETMKLLDEVALKIGCLTIRWIRGHQRHIGNERADLMARRGRDSTGPPTPDSPSIAKATMKLDLDTAAKKLWKLMWNMDPSCRQSKMWCPHGPRPRFAFEILRLPRLLCSQVIHFVTGHNFLRRHQALIESEELRRIEQKTGLNTDPDFHEAMEPIATCSLCGEKEESSFHIMTECQKLNTTRLGVFGKDEILPPYDNIPVYKLISYLRDVKLKSLEMRPFVEEYSAKEIQEHLPDWAEAQGSIDEGEADSQADAEYARVYGDGLLHQYLYQKYSAKKLDTL